jgi:hypothetical protein
MRKSWLSSAIQNSGCWAWLMKVISFPALCRNCSMHLVDCQWKIGFVSASQITEFDALVALPSEATQSNDRWSLLSKDFAIAVQHDLWASTIPKRLSVAISRIWT